MNTLMTPTPGEVDVYQGYITQMMSGLAPYRDYWFEYPPGLLPIAALPQMLITNPDYYFYAWRVVMLLVIAFCCYLIPRAKRTGAIDREEVEATENKQIFMLSTGVFEFLGILLASGLFLFHRYDFFVAAIVLFGVVAYRHKKYPLSMAMMVLGAFTKLYPILFVPILLYYTPIKEWVKTILIGLLVGVPLYLYWLPGLPRFLEFHGNKPVQIESIQGTYHRMKPIVYERFSYVYEGAESNKVWQYGLIALSLAYVIAMKKRITLEMSCTVVLTAFLIGGNIFSPQYMLWYASFVPFLPRVYSLHLIGITWLTAYYFNFYEAIIAKMAPETLLLTIRNSWLIGLFVQMITRKEIPWKNDQEN